MSTCIAGCPPTGGMRPGQGRRARDDATPLPPVARVVGVVRRTYYSKSLCEWHACMKLWPMQLPPRECGQTILAKQTLISSSEEIRGTARSHVRERQHINLFVAQCRSVGARCRSWSKWRSCTPPAVVG